MELRAFLIEVRNILHNYNSRSGVDKNPKVKIDLKGADDTKNKCKITMLHQEYYPKYFSRRALQRI